MGGKNNDILHEVFKKLILTLSTLNVELKQTQKIHDMIKSEFASIFVEFCYSQDGEFFRKRQEDLDEQARQEKEKTKEQNQSNCGKSKCGANNESEDYTRPDEDFPEKEPKEKKPADVKKLYRKIAKAVHPDKHGDMDEGEEKEHLIDLYKEATVAYNKIDMTTLICIAVELGIKTPDPDNEQMQVLHEKVNDIKIDIATIENTVAWVWYHSNEADRAHLMQKHYEYVRGKNEQE